MATTVTRFSNTVEHRESTALAAADDAFEVDCKSDSYTFLLTTTGSAEYVIALEMSTANAPTEYFAIDTNKTLSSAGNYDYSYTGIPASRVRVRIVSITSGTPNVTPQIIVHKN